MKRRLAAILSADVVGYSRLIVEDEARTLAALRELRLDIVADALERHNGQLIKSMGDGWLMEFDSIGHAVACAQMVQHALREHDWLSLRIGVHLGDITVEDDDIFGDGVNIAARLQAIAPAGGLLISQDVERQLDGQARRDFAAAGHRQLKNIDKKIDLFVWPAEAIAALADGDADAGGGKPRLFIEPFAVTGSAEEEALSKGIVEQLAETLDTMRNFLIVTRPEDANYLLRGSLRASGHLRRLQAHLVYCPEQDRFWSKHFDFDGEDVFESQDFFADALFNTVRGRINNYDGRRVRQKDASQMTVDELLSLSAHKFMQNDIQLWREIMADMDRALAIDPDNAAALARWANATLGECFLCCRRVAPELQQEAKARANRAQQLDPQSVFVLMVQAHISLYFDAAHDDAIITAERALAMNPQSIVVRNIKCQALILAGRCREGIEQMVPVAELNPDNVYLGTRLGTHALGHFGLANYDEAATLYRQAERASPNGPPLLMGLITSLWHNGDKEEAEKIAQRLMAKHPGLRLVDAYLPPWREQDTMLLYVEGLRAAGLPE